jgi:hypothetical protein
MTAKSQVRGLFILVLARHLKTARTGDRSRGFESHALRSAVPETLGTQGKPVCEGSAANCSLMLAVARHKPPGNTELG